MLGPVLSLALGHGLVGAFGHAARWVGAGMLIATGGYGLVQPLRAGTGGPRCAWPGHPDHSGVSVDNLAVGFALGTYHVSLALAAIVIAR